MDPPAEVNSPQGPLHGHQRRFTPGSNNEGLVVYTPLDDSAGAQADGVPVPKDYTLCDSTYNKVTEMVAAAVARG